MCLLVWLFLGGCIDHDEMVGKFLPAHIDSYARDYINKVVNKDFQGVYEPLNPELKNEKTKQAIGQVFDYVKGTEIVSLQVAGINTHEYSGDKNYKLYNLTYQIEFPAAWQVANLLLFENEQGILVNHININDIPASLPEMNKFTFRGKPMRHFVFLAATIAYIGILVFALLACLMTKNLRKKWLWAIVTLLGIVKFNFDWTTGQYFIQPVNFGFAISGFYSPSPFMPVILQFYFPVGAIIFLARRKSLVDKRHLEASQSEIGPDASG